ncbi:hypothetical protein GCM10010464_07880 [Pseudonocardia yunnanensis]
MIKAGLTPIGARAGRPPLGYRALITKWGPATVSGTAQGPEPMIKPLDRRMGTGGRVQYCLAAQTDDQDRAGTNQPRAGRPPLEYRTLITKSGPVAVSGTLTCPDR